MIDLLLPEANGVVYHGSEWAFRYLVFVTCVSTFRSFVHMYAKDGGANSIAKLDIDNKGGQNLVAIFSQWGASQLILAMIQWVVVLRYKFLTPFMILVWWIENLLRLLNAYFKPLKVEKMPPGGKGSRIFIVLSPVFLYLSL